ncbi:MAG: molybdate ABC transporter substrate-binding protein [Magnetococcus sp. DMHC-8]
MDDQSTRWRPWLLLALLCWPVTSPAETVRVAVAANFSRTLHGLADQFAQESGHTLLISAGSSGKLFAQIRQGAPFHLFLSADMERPRRLLQEGLAVPDSLFVYARGRLVLWSADPHRFANGAHPLTAGLLTRLALGNPRSVPYGRAAREVLDGLGLSSTYDKRLVFGEDVGQVLAFVASGNAEAGFVALSQLLNPHGQPRPGSHWEVPIHLYQPVQQGAVRLPQAGPTEPTLALIRFLRAPTTRALLARQGYLPADAADQDLP